MKLKFLIFLFLLMFFYTTNLISQSLQKEISILILDIIKIQQFSFEDIEFLSSEIQTELNKDRNFKIYTKKNFNKLVEESKLEYPKLLSETNIKQFAKRLAIDNIIIGVTSEIDADLFKITLKIFAADTMKYPTISDTIAFINRLNLKSAAKNLSKDIKKCLSPSKHFSIKPFLPKLAILVEIAILIDTIWYKNEKNRNKKLPDPPVFPLFFNKP